jgi:uncharacterized protein YgiM (DUF1202 family)
MTDSGSSVVPKAVKAAIAVVLLVVLVMVVLSYWGTYRSTKSGSEAASETTATVESTASAEPTESPEGGEAESQEGQESQGTVIVLIDGLNFRTAPSKSGDLIRGLDEGTELVYLGTEQDWYKVQTSDGKVGYVSSSQQYTELKQ